MPATSARLGYRGPGGTTSLTCSPGFARSTTLAPSTSRSATTHETARRRTPGASGRPNGPDSAFTTAVTFCDALTRPYRGLRATTTYRRPPTSPLACAGSESSRTSPA